MTIWRWICCALLLNLATAQAADGDGRFAVKGAGRLSCQTYVDERERRSNTYHLVGGWVQGFISAHNRYAEDTYDLLSFEGLELLLLLIDRHCRANPSDQLYPVLNTIMQTLHADRLRQQSEGVQIADGQRRTLLYRETIRRIQQALTTLGLYKADIDGVFSDATKAALIAFQSDLGFEKTGFPDQATLWRLLRN